jgi:transglutaminase-like putative cysteine protease
LKKIVLILLPLMLLAIAKPVEAQAARGYYELAELNYVINADRTLSANENYVIVNTSAVWVITSTSKTIPSSDVSSVSTWDSTGSLTYITEQIGGQTKITVNFRNPVGKDQSYAFGMSYVAGGLVSGSGSKYTCRLGGINIGPTDFPYNSYVVRIQGPNGLKLFTTDSTAEVVATDPPTVKCTTRLSAPGSFEGLSATFYTSPTYYKVTMIEHFVNDGSETSRNITFDTTMFTYSQWQFAAFAGANLPLKAMYVDEENNWRGIFDVGDLQPGQSKDLNIELIYTENIYTPNISENDVGTIADMPAGLFPYLEAREYWEVNNPNIQQRADQIVGTETNAYEVARLIVEDVSGYVTYEVTPQRKGALATLLSGRGDCDCYSDLVIALSRAVGLPARIDLGWGYQENLIGHAWVEFYLPGKGWQPADPTWAKTSGDYLFKLDPIRILRYVRSINSSDSASRYTWYDAQPDVENEDASIVSLTKSEAAQVLVQAGEKAIEVASDLLASHPDEALSQELDLARAKLEQAQAANYENAILLAQEAVDHANTVIEALGEPPETGPIFPIDLRYLVLILAVVIPIVGVAAIWIHKRRA